MASHDNSAGLQGIIANARVTRVTRGRGPSDAANLGAEGILPAPQAKKRRGPGSKQQAQEAAVAQDGSQVVSKPSKKPAAILKAKKTANNVAKPKVTVPAQSMGTKDQQQRLAVKVVPAKVVVEETSKDDNVASDHEQEPENPMDAAEEVPHESDEEPVDAKALMKERAMFVKENKISVASKSKDGVHNGADETQQQITIKRNYVLPIDSDIEEDVSQLDIRDTDFGIEDSLAQHQDARTSKYREERTKFRIPIAVVKTEEEEEEDSQASQSTPKQAATYEASKENQPNFPEVTHIAYPPLGSKLSKKAQNETITNIITEAAKYLAIVYFCGEAFPATNDDRKQAYKCLLTAARSLNLEEIADRLSRDEVYRKLLRRRVIDDAQHARTDTKRDVDINVIFEHYGFHDPEVVAQTADARAILAGKLIEAQAYIYVLKDRGNVDSYIAKTAFRHPAIAHVAHLAFINNKDYIKESQLTSSLESKKHELEIPEATLALTCTIIYSHLKNIAEKKTTRNAGAHAFSAATYKPEYLSLLETLDKIMGDGSQRGYKRYHMLMHEVYQAILVNPAVSSGGHRGRPSIEPDLTAMDEDLEGTDSDVSQEV